MESFIIERRLCGLALTDGSGPTAGTHQVLGGLIFAKATEGHPDTDISHIMGKLHAQRIG